MDTQKVGTHKVGTHTQGRRNVWLGRERREWRILARASLELVPASFSYELVCHVAACVWVSMFAIWNLAFVKVFVYLFITRTTVFRSPRAAGPGGPPTAHH